jgi:hypothetical protein
VPCSFSLNLSLYGLEPLSKGLGTNLKLLTNKIAWIHWYKDLGPLSKVALILAPKLVEKLLWVSVLLCCKISFLVTHLMPYYAETDSFSPPNHLTLQITLMYEIKSKTLTSNILKLYIPELGLWFFRTVIMDPKNRPDNCWVYSCFKYPAKTSPNPSISSLVVHLPKDKSKMTLPPFSVFSCGKFSPLWVMNHTKTF